MKEQEQFLSFESSFIQKTTFVCLIEWLLQVCTTRCVCVRAFACPGLPGLRRSRFPVGKADIPGLLSEAAPCPFASPVSGKPDFGKPNRSFRCWWRRGGWKQLRLWDVVHERANSSFRGSIHPADHQRPQLSPWPLSVSFSKHPSSQCQNCATVAKLNNWPFVNRSMWVCFRLTTPPTLLTPPRTGKLFVIGCGWIAGGRRGVLCVCSNNVWKSAAGWASS